MKRIDVTLTEARAAGVCWLERNHIIFGMTADSAFCYAFDGLPAVYLAFKLHKRYPAGVGDTPEKAASYIFGEPSKIIRIDLTR